MFVSFCDTQSTGQQGVYTFRALGGMYHDLGTLTTSSTKQFLQLYIWDGSMQDDIERRRELFPSLREDVLKDLLTMLNEVNPHVQLFKRVSERGNIHKCEVRLAIFSHQDRNKYNAPSSDEIAAIWVDNSREGIGDGASHKHVLAIRATGAMQQIPYFSGLYDSLSYPLILPRG